MSPLPRQGWLFLIEFLKWYFSKYWQVRTRPVFAQTVTNTDSTLVLWKWKCREVAKIAQGEIKCYISCKTTHV